MNLSNEEQIQQLQAAVDAQEKLRPILGNPAVDLVIATLHEKLAALQMQPGLVEQRKLVTVLFADVCGFTAMSEKLDPEDVAATMNAVWVCLDAVIQTYEGWIDKHIGDAVMALFGVPVAREDDPERAVRAALDMQAALEKFRLEKAVDLNMRIAVHTGLVRLGEVGSTAEYTAMGDTVNTTSYLQHAAPVGQVLASQQTCRLVRGLFNLQPFGPVAIKGKAQKIQACIVAEAKERLFRMQTRGFEGIETQMVGRQADLALMKTAYRSVCESGQAYRMVIAGEAGIGKSRLLDEFDAWLLESQDSISFYKGRANPQSSHIPYALMRDLLAFRLGIQASDAPAVMCARLESGIMDVLGEGSQEKAHFIGHLIGLDFSASPFLRHILDDARQIHDRARHYLAQFFAADARKRPLVVFADDLHWCDEGSLALLTYLLRQRQAEPILFVALARPDLFEMHPEWGVSGERNTRIDVQLLSMQDTAGLVGQILPKMEPIPPELIDLIFERSEGNPYYIEELIKMFIEAGAIWQDAGSWQVDMQSLAIVRVPQTLAGVIQARLDRLSTPERQVLQQAAAIGQVFWDGVIERIQMAISSKGNRLDKAQITAALHSLRKKELVAAHQVSAFAGEKEFVFTHAILHNVCYESILKRRRGPIHACIADWLAEHSGERADEYAGWIAFHYERAGDNLQAGEWYGCSGRYAQNTYATQAAVEAYQKALALLPDAFAHLPRRIACYEGLGRMLFWQTHHPEAIEVYTAMLEAAEAAEDLPAQARALKSIATVLDNRGDYHAALQNASRSVEIARAANAPSELADALVWQGWESGRLGDYLSAIALGEEALKISISLGHPLPIAISLNLLGVTYDRLDDQARSIEYLERALEACRQAGDLGRTASTLNNLSGPVSITGDQARAAGLLLEAIDIAREVGSSSREIIFLGNLTAVRLAMEQYEQAEIELRQVIKMSEAAGIKYPDLYRNLVVAIVGKSNVPGSCPLNLQEQDDLLAIAMRALELAQEIGDPAEIANDWRILGMAIAARTVRQAPGAPKATPPECFAEGLRHLPEAGADYERAQILGQWAEYETKYGDRQQGKNLWLQVHHLYIRLKMFTEAEKVQENYL